jgi:hypothetical protein
MLFSYAVLLCIIQLIQSAALTAPRRFQTSMQDVQYTQRNPSHYYNKLQKVPGDSPAYYTGNPYDGILQIESLDFIQNSATG